MPQTLGSLTLVAVKTSPKDPGQYTCSLVVTMCIPRSQCMYTVPPAFPHSMHCSVLSVPVHLKWQHVWTACQVADLRKKIEEEQRMLMQWSEERLALAQSLLGLLELHVTQANKDIAAFEGELQVCSFPPALCSLCCHPRPECAHMAV